MYRKCGQRCGKDDRRKSDSCDNKSDSYECKPRKLSVERLYVDKVCARKGKFGKQKVKELKAKEIKTEKLYANEAHIRGDLIVDGETPGKGQWLKEVARVVFCNGVPYFNEYWNAVFPDGITRELPGGEREKVPVTSDQLGGYFYVNGGSRLGAFQNVYRNISVDDYNAAGQNDIVGSGNTGTKAEYEKFLEGFLKMYTDSIPKPGEFQGVLPPIGSGAGVVAWKHRSGTEIGVGSLINGVVIYNLDRMKEYPGTMTYQEAIERGIILKFVATPINGWHEIEHTGPSFGPDWIYVITENAAVSAGLMIIDATDLDDIKVTNLDQSAPNGGLVNVGLPEYGLHPRYLNVGKKVEPYNPKCPKFEGGGLFVGAHFLRKENGYINVTNRNVIWFVGTLLFNDFLGSECIPPRLAVNNFTNEPYLYGYPSECPPCCTSDNSIRSKTMVSSKAISLNERQQRLLGPGALESDDAAVRNRVAFAADKTDPANPVPIEGSLWSRAYLHDINFLTRGDKIYGFGCAIFNDTIYVIDITDLNNVGIFDYVSRYIHPRPYFNPFDTQPGFNGVNLPHSITFDLSERFAYVFNENYGVPGLVLDVSDIRNIRLIRYLDIPGRPGVLLHEGSHERDVSKGIDRLYIAAYNDGVLVLDTFGKNAANPKIIAYNSASVTTGLDNAQWSNNSTFSGFWGAHPVHGGLNYCVGHSQSSFYYQINLKERGYDATGPGDETIDADEAFILFKTVTLSDQEYREKYFKDGQGSNPVNFN